MVLNGATSQPTSEVILDNDDSRVLVVQKMTTAVNLNMNSAKKVHESSPKAAKLASP